MDLREVNGDEAKDLKAPPRNLLCSKSLGFGDLCFLFSVDAAAQIAERGKKIATSVRTLESIEGRSVLYCKMEKIANQAVSC